MSRDERQRLYDIRDAIVAIRQAPRPGDPGISARDPLD